MAKRRVHRTTQGVPRVRFEADEVTQLRPPAKRAYRPLVLPVARTILRTVPHLLAPTVAGVPTVPAVDVERRGLTLSQQLADACVDEVA